MKYLYGLALTLVFSVVIGCQPAPLPVDSVLMQNTVAALGNTAVAAAWTNIAQTQVALTQVTPTQVAPTRRPVATAPLPKLAGEDKTSFDFKVKVYKFIEERYLYYDKIEGGYAGDKYTKIIFKEAANKYGITVEFIDSFWGNTEIAQAARDSSGSP